MAFPPLDTCEGIVLSVQNELGLPPRGADDATGTQLMALLSSAGQELLLFYPWQQLNKDFDVTLVSGTEQYDMPDDWAYFVDQTQWDRTNQWPLSGPSSPQQWRWLKDGITTVGPRLRYRVRNNKFQVFPDTSTSELRMEYIMRTWVTDTAGTTFYRSVQNGDNIVLLDSFLLQKYIKLKFWETKGFDTGAFRDDFMRVYWNLIGKDKGAPILSLSRRPSPYLLSHDNVPDGTWQVTP